MRTIYKHGSVSVLAKESPTPLLFLLKQYPRSVAQYAVQSKSAVCQSTQFTRSTCGAYSKAD